MDSEQLTALGYCVVYAQRNLLDGSGDLRRVADELEARHRPGDPGGPLRGPVRRPGLARPRRQEILACLNRCRGCGSNSENERPSRREGRSGFSKFQRILGHKSKSTFIDRAISPASPVLDGHDLIHPALVAPPLKVVGEEGGHDLPGQERPHHAGPQGQHVGVVVAAGHLRAPGVAAKGTADAMDLVGGHGDADAVVQMTMPRSQVSAATARAAAWAKSG